MGSLDVRRRLIVNADDFGRSHSINQAVVQAHRDGILTTASVMVTGEAFAQAVELARQNPRLGVGLHLTLVCGRPALSASQIPGLLGSEGAFLDIAVAAGLRFFFRPGLRHQLQAEIAAQIQRFHDTGLTLDHLNGHLNFHLHPTVLRLLLCHAHEWKVSALRLTYDPPGLDLHLNHGRWGYRSSHAIIFSALAAWARPALRRAGLRHTHRVFGLLRNAIVDEPYVVDLLARLPPGDSELYSHPSLDDARPELNALVSPQVRRLIQQNDIQLIRYQDL